MGMAPYWVMWPLEKSGYRDRSLSLCMARDISLVFFTRYMFMEEGMAGVSLYYTFTPVFGGVGQLF
jgi:hypothetical protein